MDHPGEMEDNINLSKKKQERNKKRKANKNNKKKKSIVPVSTIPHKDSDSDEEVEVPPEALEHYQKTESNRKRKKTEELTEKSNDAENTEISSKGNKKRKMSKRERDKAWLRKNGYSTTADLDLNNKDEGEYLGQKQEDVAYKEDESETKSENVLTNRTAVLAMRSNYHSVKQIEQSEDHYLKSAFSALKQSAIIKS